MADTACEKLPRTLVRWRGGGGRKDEEGREGKGKKRGKKGGWESGREEGGREGERRGRKKDRREERRIITCCLQCGPPGCRTIPGEEECHDKVITVCHVLYVLTR